MTHRKDFDGWNQQKKGIENDATRRFYHPREVWWCALGVNIGFEEDGTGKSFERPVLILKALSRKTCLVAPLTTAIYPHKYRASVGSIDGQEAQAILSQVRVIDTKRLINRVDILDEAVFEEVRKAATALL